MPQLDNSGGKLKILFCFMRKEAVSRLSYNSYDLFTSQHYSVNISVSPHKDYLHAIGVERKYDCL